MIKNIIIVEDSSKHKFGGGQRVTLDVIDCLSKKYKLYLIDCKKKTFFNNLAKEKIFDFLPLFCFGKVKHTETSSFSMGWKEIFLFPILLIMNYFKIIIFCKKMKFNKQDTVFYVSSKKTLIFIYLISLLFKYKYVYHSHGYDNKKSFFYYLITPALKKASKIICVSNLIKNNHNLKNCSLLYNSVNLEDNLIRSIKNKNQIYVASFSSLIKIKGIEYLMQSHQYVKNKNNINFLVYGEGPERENLINFVNENVQLKGFSNDVFKELKNIDILVLPSIIEEACPMIILESFVYGIPVITTDIGGQAEIVKNSENGYLVRIKNSKEIARSIDKMLNNEEEYEKLSKNALEYIKKFSKENFNNEINEIIKDISDSSNK